MVMFLSPLSWMLPGEWQLKLIEYSLLLKEWKEMELYCILQLLRFSLLHNLLTFAFLFSSTLAKIFYILCSIIYVYLYKQPPLYITSLICNIYMYKMIMPVKFLPSLRFYFLTFPISSSNFLSPLTSALV